jgi:hypothetical protein
MYFAASIPHLFICYIQVMYFAASIPHLLICYIQVMYFAASISHLLICYIQVMYFAACRQIAARASVFLRSNRPLKTSVSV